jgi:O-antigen/teichoic acid export membrane protein
MVAEFSGDTPGRSIESASGEAQAEVASNDLVERASLRRNIAHMASSQAVTWALATISAIIIPRFIGPTDVGELSLVSSIWGIVAVFAPLGTSMYLQRAIARDQREGLALLSPILVIRTVMFGLTSILLVLYGVVVGSSRDFVLIALAGGLITFVTLWSEAFDTVFVGLERIATAAVGAVLTRLVTLILTVAVLLAGAAIWGILSVRLTAAIFGLVFVFSRYSRLRLGRNWQWRGRLRQIVVASAPFMLVGLALTTYRQIDVIVIAQVAGSRDLGWYSAADVLVGSLLFPTTVLMAAIFPTFGRLNATDRTAFEELVGRAYSMLFLAAVPIGLGAMAVAPAFTRLLYGAEFEGTGPVVAIEAVMTMFTFGATLLAYAAFAVGRERFVAMLIFACAALTIPLDLVFVPWANRQFDNGAIGGAITYVVTEAFQFIVLLVVIAPFVVTRSWTWKSARVLAAGLLMAAAIWPLRDMFIVIPAGVGALVYVFLIVLFRALDGSERELAREVLGRLRGHRRGDIA